VLNGTSFLSSSWQNIAEASDVNYDGTVSPLDALTLINALNNDLGGNLEDQARQRANQHDTRAAGSQFFVDPSGDGMLTPLDVLEVINDLNGALTRGPDVSSPDISPSSSDLHPDTPGDDATPLEFHQGFATVNSLIDTAGDVDVFKFTAEANERLAVAGLSLSEGMAINLKVTGSEGNEVARSEEQGDAQWSQPLEFDVKKGALYYVSVSGTPVEAAGEYVLDAFRLDREVDFVDYWGDPDSEKGDDPHADEHGDEANELKFDEWGMATVHSFVDAPGDLDVFSFSKSEGETVTFSGFGVSCEFEVELHVLDADGNEVARSQAVGLGAAAIELKDGEGKHYVVVSGEDEGETGQYLLVTAKIRNADLPDPWGIPKKPDEDEPSEDQHADEVGEDATVLKFDSYGSAIVDSRIDTPGDIDVFQFSLEQQAVVDMSGMGHPWDNALDVALTLYDGSGKQFRAWDTGDRWGTPQGEELAAGRYFVSVAANTEDGTGGYRLDVWQIDMQFQPPSTNPPEEVPWEFPWNDPWKDPGSEQPRDPQKTPPNVPPNDPEDPKDDGVRFPDVPYFGGANDWNLNAINAPEAWAQGYTGKGVTIAVIDTGIQFDHPEFADAIWTNAQEIAGNQIDDDGNGYVDDYRGWDFAHDDNDPTDLNGHGSHTAGTIVAARDDTGSTGVAYDSKVMALQALNVDGDGDTSNVAAAVRYAVDNGARVISMSLGGAFSPVLVSALEYARDNSVFVAAAAGNNGWPPPDFPAALSARLGNVLSVGAHDGDNQLAWFSNAVGGSGAVQVDAPGVNVHSTVNGDGYARFTGTSMSTPHAAGVAALALSADPELTASKLRELIVKGADRRIGGSDSAGGLNAATVVASAAGYTSTSTRSSSNPSTGDGTVSTFDWASLASNANGGFFAPLKTPTDSVYPVSPTDSFVPYADLVDIDSLLFQGSAGAHGWGSLVDDVISSMVA